MVPVKNQYILELHTSDFHREMITEITTAYSTDLIVLNGVEAFIDDGPDRGS